MYELRAQLDVAYLLNNHLPHSADSAWFLAPHIPDKKLQNALGKYARNADTDSILALGDGTVFGSAKEGVLITADTLYSNTTEEKFTISLHQILGAKKLHGWPSYGIELQCQGGAIHKIMTTCFDKQQDGLTDFFNAVAAVNTALSSNREQSKQEQAPLVVREEPQHFEEEFYEEPPMTIVEEPATIGSTHFERTSIDQTSVSEINNRLKLIDVCPNQAADDVGALFESALQSESEIPLLKGYCQYVGFNARNIDGIAMLTNQRLLLFSMESGAKVTFVELTKRLLGKLPVPFLDSLVGFFCFTIPGSIITALRGGKDNLIIRALTQDEEQLLSDNPPLHKVQDFDFDDLRQTVSQIEISNEVCTGFLERKFGISFAPLKIAKTFSVPKDLILPHYDSAAPFQKLLDAIRPALLRQGMDYQFNTEAQTITIAPAASGQKNAA